MQAEHFDACNFLDQRFQYWPGRFDKLRPNLLEQIAPLFGRKRFHKLLFRGSQYALEPHYDQIINQVRMNALRPTAHELLLEPRNPLANSGFDFS